MSRTLRWLHAALPVLLLLAATGAGASAQDGSPPEVAGPAVAIPGAPLPITVTLPEGAALAPYSVVAADGAELASGTLNPGENKLEGVAITARAQLPLRVVAGGAQAQVAPRYLPAWVSLVPPLLAIALALIFREVVIALFAGVWLGAFLWTGLNPFTAVLRTVDTFALPELADSDHAAIILFSLMIGGMVGVIGRNGGTFGIVERLSPLATTPRRGLFATYVQGLAIFFDDYANTLIVGNTMRPVTDRLKVSREKLAYVVDSTSAPVASIMFVSTWVGYEISLIADGLQSASVAVAARDPELGRRLADASAFNVFIDTIPYRFYPLLALLFVLLVIWMRRDFGPMYRAEVRARTGGGVHRAGAALLTDTSTGAMDPPEGAPLRWVNAAVPVLAVVLTVLLGLYFSGRGALGPGDHSLREVFGEANSFHVLLWASLLGSITAIVLTLGQRILSVQETMAAWLTGVRSMVLAMVILVLAWSLGSVTEVLGTAQYVSSILQGNVSAQLLPVIVFAVAAAISFATGTSWGTMAILLPLVIPLGASLTAAGELGDGGHYTILLGVVSSVLAGSIFGDHCSPISDTTVMSSMASACDHMDHVRTQLPYALVVALVGMAVGDVPTAYGLSPWVSLAVGAVILVLVVRFVGRPTDVGTLATLTPREARTAVHDAV
ncbi:MAG TPA: Na+/H+ antiporter NhaC family protein [Longimicrobiaceae bacterium]|nr:Na+/H+ antiporter NhaC family protein [Longimicrobiaceae bacterium]